VRLVAASYFGSGDFGEFGSGLRAPCIIISSNPLGRMRTYNSSM
jgi:hypothetical protein